MNFPTLKQIVKRTKQASDKADRLGRKEELAIKHSTERLRFRVRHTMMAAANVGNMQCRIHTAQVIDSAVDAVEEELTQMGYSVARDDHSMLIDWRDG